MTLRAFSSRSARFSSMALFLLSSFSRICSCFSRSLSLIFSSFALSSSSWVGACGRREIHLIISDLELARHQI